MNRLKKQTTICCVISLLFSLALFAFSFIEGIESSAGLLFIYKFLNITTPLLIFATLIGLVRLKVNE